MIQHMVFGQLFEIEEATIRNFRIVQNEDTRQVNRQIMFIKKQYGENLFIGNNIYFL